MLSLEDFMVCMAPLTRHWPEPTPEQWSDYRALLGHLDAPILAAAVLKVMAEHVYPTFPKPAQIVQAAGQIITPDKRSGLDAWGDVMKAVARHGYLHPPGDGWDFDDASVGVVVRQIGWNTICQSEDEMVMRAHWIKSYEQQRDRAHEAARELPAVTDARQLAAGRRAEMAQLTAGIGRRG